MHTAGVVLTQRATSHRRLDLLDVILPSNFGRRLRFSNALEATLLRDDHGPHPATEIQ